MFQQGLIHHVPRLQDELIPRTPKSHPSGRPLPAGSSSTGTPATGASAGPPGGTQPTPQGGGSRPALNEGGGSRPSLNQGGGSRPTSNQGGSASTPSQSGQPTSGDPTDQPPAIWEQAMAPGPAGIRGPCESTEVESLSLRGLPCRSHRPR